MIEDDRRSCYTTWDVRELSLDVGPTSYWVTSGCVTLDDVAWPSNMIGVTLEPNEHKSGPHLHHVHQPPASCHNVRWRLEFPSWGWDRWSEALDLRVQSFTTFWAPLIFLGICRLQDFLGGTLHSWARLACLPLWRLTF
jgi:hypothetical protein